MQKINDQVLLGLKIAVFAYIVLSPFLDHRNVMFLNSVGSKIFIILLIVVASFIDLQLAILMTLGLLVIVINLNKDTIFKKSVAKEHFSVNMPVAVPVAEPFATQDSTPEAKMPVQQTIHQFPDTCEHVQTLPREMMSDNLYSLYIDPKIKPYENYIRMLSSPEMVENASNGAYDT